MTQSELYKMYHFQAWENVVWLWHHLQSQVHSPSPYSSRWTFLVRFGQRLVCWGLLSWLDLTKKIFKHFGSALVLNIFLKTPTPHNNQLEMSSSKVAEQPQRPKCSRCRHHGIIVPLKGHMKWCPFRSCVCWKCHLITQRTRITTLQRRAKSTEQRPAGEGTCGASALDGGAHRPATSGLTDPPLGEAPERAATSASCPLDLRSRPAARGDNVTPLSLASSEEGSCTPLSMDKLTFSYTN